MSEFDELDKHSLFEKHYELLKWFKSLDIEDEEKNPIYHLILTQGEIISRSLDNREQLKAQAKDMSSPNNNNNTVNVTHTGDNNMGAKETKRMIKEAYRELNEKDRKNAGMN